MIESRNCSSCGELFTFESKNRNRSYSCRECTKKYAKGWLAKNPDKKYAMYRRSHLKSKFGITLEEYDKLLRRCGGLCEICGRPPSRRSLNIDHDHVTNEIRGLLCNDCNLAIGLLGDTYENVKEALHYMKRFEDRKVGDP